MTAMLMPKESRYFAIYTVGKSRRYGHIAWDLHATAADKRTAMEHARLLSLQPHVNEVQVKQIVENNTSGLVRVREVKRLRKNSGQHRLAAAFGGVCLLALGLIYALI